MIPTQTPPTQDEIDAVWRAGTRVLLELIAISCTTPGCADAAYLHPTTLRAEDFDPAVVVCDDCGEASIPDDVRAMRPAPAPSATGIAA